MKRIGLFLALAATLVACHVSSKSAMYSPYHLPGGAAIDTAGGDGGAAGDGGSSGSSD